jgi:hypothetical protein
MGGSFILLPIHSIIYTIESNSDINRDITWFHRLAALKLAKECNEALFKLTAEGPSVMHVKLLGNSVELCSSIVQ